MSDNVVLHEKHGIEVGDIVVSNESITHYCPKGTEVEVTRKYGSETWADKLTVKFADGRTQTYFAWRFRKKETMTASEANDSKRILGQTNRKVDQGMFGQAPMMTLWELADIQEKQRQAQQTKTD